MPHKYRKIENPLEHLDKLCHVDKWKFGCVFKLIETDGHFHTLETPKTKKRYRTSNGLFYTRRDQAELWWKEEKERRARIKP